MVSVIGILLFPYCIGTICSLGRERFGEINVDRLQHTGVC